MEFSAFFPLWISSGGYLFSLTQVWIKHYLFLGVRPGEMEGGSLCHPVFLTFLKHGHSSPSFSKGAGINEVLLVGCFHL